MNKRELKEKLESITRESFDYNVEEYYTALYNTCIDYMNDTQDFDLEELFYNFITYDEAEEIAKNEIDRGGLIRIYYFLGDANLNDDLFRLNGYGNLENVYNDDIDTLKEEIIERL